MPSSTLHNQKENHPKASAALGGDISLESTAELQGALNYYDL